MEVFNVKNVIRFHRIWLSCTALFCAIGVISAQEQPPVESAAVPAESVKFTAGQPAAYSPDQVKIVGMLASGQTSPVVAYSSTPQYRAFVFEANGNDRVDV